MLLPPCVRMVLGAPKRHQVQQKGAVCNCGLAPNALSPSGPLWGEGNPRRFRGGREAVCNQPLSNLKPLFFLPDDAPETCVSFVTTIHRPQNPKRCTETQMDLSECPLRNSLIPRRTACQPPVAMEPKNIAGLRYPRTSTEHRPATAAASRRPGVG